MRRTLVKASACATQPFRDTMEGLNPQILGTMRWTFDTKKSKGSKLVDDTGREFLDTFMQISSIPLGYNNDELKAAIACDDTLSMIVSRPAMGVFPPAELPNLLKPALSIAPMGMQYIQTLMCGSCTVENAMKSAFGFYAYNKRGGQPPGMDAHTSCMDGLAPGSPNIAALSFRGCFHGRTFGSLSLTNSKSAIKVDMPAFEWPHAPFPQLKYPLHEHERENAEEEAKCLEVTQDLFDQAEKKGQPIAAVIIEPIQGEGGDARASDDFYRKLIDVARDNGAVMVVDEVQTGFGATGKWWASDYWEKSSDIVCYAKKSQACGFFYTDDFKANPETRIFNTWMGEPLKLVMMNKIIEIVQRDRLLDNVNRVGQVLQDGFVHMEDITGGMVNSGRGRGLYTAFSVATPELRDKMIKSAFDKNLIVGACGTSSIRFRPSLNFSSDEAEQAIGILSDCASELYHDKQTIKNNNSTGSSEGLSAQR